MKLQDFDLRVWNDKLGGYAESPFYFLYLYTTGQEIHTKIDNKEINPCIELWSGFRDKNGTKIYEGDIVSFEADSHDMGILIIAGKVVFKNGRFIIEGYEKIFPHYSFYDFVLKDKGIKIIGNIHENPELLGGEE